MGVFILFIPLPSLHCDYGNLTHLPCYRAYVFSCVIGLGVKTGSEIMSGFDAQILGHSALWQLYSFSLVFK